MKLIDKPTLSPISAHPTSNGTMGVSDFACECETNLNSLYTMFSGASLQLGTRGIGSWFSWFQKFPVKISSIYIDKDESPASITIATIQGSNDYSNWTNISFTTEEVLPSSDIIVTLSNNNYYYYYKLTFTDITAASISVKLNGYYIGSTTASILKPTRKYYKYVDTAFTTPILSDDGLIDSYKFSVKADAYSTYHAWRLFDGSSSTGFIPAARTGDIGNTNIIMYNPNPLKITSIAMTNNLGTTIKAGGVLASVDNVTYTLLTSFTNTNATSGATWDIDLSSNTNFYKYYKIQFTEWTWTTQRPRSFAEVGLTAVERNTVSSDETDYDFYIDIDGYKTIV